jgi:hypothetical protein
MSENYERLKCSSCSVQCELGQKLVSLVTQRRGVQNTALTLLGAGEGIFNEFVDLLPPALRQDVSFTGTIGVFGKEWDFFDCEIDFVLAAIDDADLACASLLKNWLENQTEG